MKLVLCPKCWDVFKLAYKMRQCECGSVKGRYIDNTFAEVTPSAVSIGIGNGALEQAIYDMQALQRATNDMADRRTYHEPGNGLIKYAWVRPNAGPGNPHTKLMEVDNGK